MIKKTLRTILISVLSLAVVFSLVACSSKKKDEEDSQDYITVGRVCALSGSLNQYGQGSPEVEEYAVEKINKDGGIFIKEKDKKMPIRFVVEDSHSTADGAKEAATKLIEEDKVDIMIVSETSKIVIPVSEVCEQKGIPCIAVNARNDLWIEHGPYDYSFNASYDMDSLLKTINSLWKKAGVENLGFMAPDTDYGRDVAEKVKEYCLYNKINLIDFGRFEEGITDYETIITLLKNDNVDGLLCFMDNVDFEVFYKQVNDKKLAIKQCTLINDSYLDADIRTMGKSDGFARGVCSKLIWNSSFPYKSSIDGTTSKDLEAWWSKNFSSSCPEMLGIKYANVELLVDILKRAQSVDSDKVAEVAKKTNLQTVIGNISFNDKNQAILPCVVCQWNYDGEKPEGLNWTQDIIDNSTNNDIITTKELNIIIR